MDGRAKYQRKAKNMSNEGLTYFRNRRSDEAIVEARDKQLIKDAGWSTIACIACISFTINIDSRLYALIETAIDPPNATQALSIVSARPQILSNPYCLCS